MIKCGEAEPTVNAPTSTPIASPRPRTNRRREPRKGRSCALCELSQIVFEIAQANLAALNAGHAFGETAEMSEQVAGYAVRRAVVSVSSDRMRG